MGKHDFKWTTPETAHISYDPPKDDFYKARIATLERENAELHRKIEKNAELYGMGKDAIDTVLKELNEENDKLRDRVTRLEIALIRSEIRDVSV